MQIKRGRNISPWLYGRLAEEQWQSDRMKTAEKGCCRFLWLMLITWQHLWRLQMWKGVRSCSKEVRAVVPWLRSGSALCTAFLTLIASWRQLHLTCYSVGLCSPSHKPQPAVRKAWTYQSDVLLMCDLSLVCSCLQRFSLVGTLWVYWDTSFSDV